MVGPKKRRKRGLKRSEIVGFVVMGLFIAAVIYVVIPSQPNATVTNTSTVQSQSTATKPALKAAIVDQLSVFSDSDFTDQAKKIMEQAGFRVDVYGPDKVKVDLYASISRSNYEIIVFRVHAGVNDQIASRPVGLFTTEPYSQFKYQSEQLNDLVGSAQAFNRSEAVFAVTPKFLREKSLGNYNDAVIILMGCFGLHSADLPQAFIDRGASVVVGWNELVDIKHTDKATLTLLRFTILQKMSVDEAVTKTMSDVGADSTGSVLGYVPLEKGGFTFFQFSCEILVTDRWKTISNLHGQGFRDSAVN